MVRVYGPGKIMNDECRVAEQLDRLKEDFLKCKYPDKLIEDIFKKVKLMKRNLRKRRDTSAAEEDQRIMAITTHGRDQPLVTMINKIEKKH